MSKLTRKEFLQRIAALGFCGVAAGSLLFRCGGGESEKQTAKTPRAAPEDPCADVSGLSPEETATRTVFKYGTHSPDPKKICSGCALYKDPAPGEACGTCQIIKGPVHPNGHCINWVAPA